MEPFEDPQNNERIFTLSEANCLIPQLEQLWMIIKEERNVLINTKEEIKRPAPKLTLAEEVWLAPVIFKPSRKSMRASIRFMNGASSSKTSNQGFVIFPICWMEGSSISVGNSGRTRFTVGMKSMEGIPGDKPCHMMPSRSRSKIRLII